jgi:hypothetical protein
MRALHPTNSDAAGQASAIVHPIGGLILELLIPNLFTVEAALS